jgi:hypothetical protein
MTSERSNLNTTLNSQGFTLIRVAVDAGLLGELTAAVEAVRHSHTSPGLRNLLSRSDAVRRFAYSPVAMEIASCAVGESARPVRSILFDKTPASNWYVTWHQDVTIPVKEKIEVEGFAPWSVKDGIVHVQPPASILERMVSLRIHLDPCSEENGAIKFILGSHLEGVLEAPDLVRWRDANDAVICAAQQGDIIAMRPLVLHSSSVSQAPEHRRVLHIEYAGVDLPSGLKWAEA